MRQILNKFRLLNDTKLLYQQLNYYYRFPIFQWIMGYDHNKEKIFSYKSSIPQKDDVQLRDVKLQFEWSKFQGLFNLKLKLEFVIILRLLTNTRSYHIFFRSFN